MVKTTLEIGDRLGTVRARLGILRDEYKVVPGIYGVGSPDRHSPVLVTANYKLSFDCLRRHLQGLDAWILVLDTRGINVWCAAGKGTFATDELVKRIRSSHIARLVDHRSVIVPQLGATGVSALRVRRLSGFKVIWGPIRAEDIKAFLAAGHGASQEMREVTFPLRERMVLIPVEIRLLIKYLAWLIPVVFLVSGIGPAVFSFQAAWSRGILLLFSVLAGIVAGTVVTPILLLRLPGVFFSIKGAIAGVAAGIVSASAMPSGVGVSGLLALVLITTSLGSYLAMNFTGSTPFTSPSGVEHEMKRSLPWQISSVAAGTLLWLISAF